MGLLQKDVGINVVKCDYAAKAVGGGRVIPRDRERKCLFL